MEKGPRRAAKCAGEMSGKAVDGDDEVKPLHDAGKVERAI
jgi:hypothetical protein